MAILIQNGELSHSTGSNPNEVRIKLRKPYLFPESGAEDDGYGHDGRDVRQKIRDAVKGSVAEEGGIQ